MATNDPRLKKPERECFYKIKYIQFFGRTTPIILENDNGPFPLLALCNVLLLKNELNLDNVCLLKNELNSDRFFPEVSRQELLSLLAERLIEFTSDDLDIIDLLSQLSRGINVNIKFKRIDDFELKSVRAIFDLLGIPLYHGWIVDPWDYDTVNAIGIKSYNNLSVELDCPKTINTEEEHKSNSGEHYIDFAAATTATLGVPSPCLSQHTSFDDSRGFIFQKRGRGDIEEEAELLRVLKLSEAELQTSGNESQLADANWSTTAASSIENTHLKSSGLRVPSDKIEGHIFDEHQIHHQPEPYVSQDCNASSSCSNDGMFWEALFRESGHSSMTEAGIHLDQSNSKESGECSISTDWIENMGRDELVQNSSGPLFFPGRESSLEYKDHLQSPGGDQEAQQMRSQDTSKSEIHHVIADHDCDSMVLSDPQTPNADSDVSSPRSKHSGVQDDVTSSLDYSESINGGVERILDSGPTIYENQEPMDEGEMILAEQADRGKRGAFNVCPDDEITPHKGEGLLSVKEDEGELVRNFLKNNASQLTTYGLFCMQERLKERELCVFFRNNHFNAMFKFNGELYLLATDQGYINEPDLVWKKLNEFNGDTVFMTGNFKEFKVENHVNDTWDGLNTMASTAEYLASINNSAPPDSTLDADLQLAIALQQLEYKDQPQFQESSTSGSSRLATGSQINGDTVFMTGNFKEFKEYLASINNSTPPDSTLDVDLQLAIALQQLEYKNQPQFQESSTSGSSRLVTGSQESEEQRK